MTREEAKELLPVIKAYVEGKTIQFNHLGKWVDVVSELNPEYYPLKYRIKPEQKYRPFKSQEECWQEMLKHQPFGWVRTIISDNLRLIESIIPREIFCNRTFTPYKEAFEWLKFADGTPFGIKEE